jgi:hypothetical protein
MNGFSEGRALFGVDGIGYANISTGATLLASWSNHPVIIATNGAADAGNSERMRVTTTGNVGIGTKNPLYQLHLSSDAAAKFSTNTWTIFSDERLKTNIEIADVSRCYDIIKSIPLKRYTWKDDVYTTEQVKDRSKLGWIAQDVESVFPKAVNQKRFSYNQKYDSSNNLISEDVIEDCRDLNADQLYAALYGSVKCLINNNEEKDIAIQELKNENASLKQELTNLQNKYHLLEDSVALLLSKM